MQQKTNTVRIEPFEHVPQVANEDFLPALTLAYAREPAPHFHIRSYDPVTPRERLIILRARRCCFACRTGRHPGIDGCVNAQQDNT